MIMTPAEAEKKYCPMKMAKIGTMIALAQAGDAFPRAATNRLHFEDEVCKAYGCMAWRWEVGTGRGYCGLAGTPRD